MFFIKMIRVLGIGIAAGLVGTIIPPAVGLVVPDFVVGISASAAGFVLGSLLTQPTSEERAAAQTAAAAR